MSQKTRAPPGSPNPPYKPRLPMNVRAVSANMMGSGRKSLTRQVTRPSYSVPGSAVRVDVPRATSRIYGLPRCARAMVLDPLTSTSGFLSYGSSSDVYKPQSNMTNPYLQLQRAVMEQLRSTRQGASPRSTMEMPGVTPPAEIDRFSPSPMKKLMASPIIKPRPQASVMEVGSSVDLPDDEEDDEDDDEIGLPQAVRSKCVSDEPANSTELTKALHVTRMEEFARYSEPAELLKKLQAAGYFQHNYGNHARTCTDQTSLKTGMKKGVERLYQILAG
ncbi:uncharacterized protein LOC131944568 [Physella acuta]|uniref:uncharacterized protein LOC131944568 n=1 Tax=Physella acuta TaxID=109671 RepID=UPI0027DB329C|nr:uncharacterized protein LOC131944568 [Physella acuta]XP_059161239.1 uncharacterized protein LOC131944568 [Physella acuta]